MKSYNYIVAMYNNNIKHAMFTNVKLQLIPHHKIKYILLLNCCLMEVMYINNVEILEILLGEALLH